MARAGKLQTASTLQSTSASITERLSDPNRWSWQLAQRMREGQAEKFDPFITWRLASPRGNDYIKRNLPCVEDTTLMIWKWDRGGLLCGPRITS